MIDREKEIKPFVKECKCIRQWPFTGFSCEISLRWEYPTRGGILAEAFGYGKTAVCIALSSLRGEGGTLVVVPPNLTGHWKGEINKFLPRAKVTVITSAARV